MKWTRKLPKVPGWYWFFGRDKKEIVVEIIDGRMSGLQFNDFRLPRDLRSWPGKWAGPIPRPKGGK